MSASRSSNLRWRLGFRNCLAVDSDGLSGGLALFGMNQQMFLCSPTQGERYIDVIVAEDPSSVPWRATFVYGEPRVEKRKDMWELMRSLCGEWLGPWFR